MGNIKLAIRTAINLLFFSCLYGFSLTVSADVPTISVPTAEQVDANGKYIVHKIRDKDYACVQCHQESKKTLHGTHSLEKMKKIDATLQCVSCHESISPDHRNNAPEVIKYSAAQFRLGTDKQQLDHQQILQANEKCSSCHTPERLRENSWTHDVHAKNLTCSSCHSVHADGKKEGIQSLERKDQIQLCVTCHKDFNATTDKKEQ
ncbi:MAG: cytochrome c nitrite reductase pentaheme subunit [Psychromonas sp.]|nr:cytochrome c nitrite reductase pentaheme subunit [Psychromonas sp.]